MFGIPSLGVTPFASQANNAFSFSVAENIGMADFSTQSQVLFNLITEDIFLDEVENDVGGNFFDGVGEGITFVD
jgi:hypothetical protein